MATALPSTAVLDGDPSWRQADVLSVLLDHLVNTGAIERRDVPSIHSALMLRETLGSTAFGRGIAIPHTRHDAIVQRTFLFARCRTPIEFDSIDGEPVDVFLLALVPKNRSGTRMSIDPMAERLLYRFRNDDFMKRIRACESADELTHVLADHSTD